MSDAAELPRRRTLGPAFDLLAAYRAPDGFFFERAGRGIAGSGASARVVIPAGDGQVARADAAVRAALAAAAYEGDAPPVAVGALPFGTARDGAADRSHPHRASGRGRRDAGDVRGTGAAIGAVRSISRRCRAARGVRRDPGAPCPHPSPTCVRWTRRSSSFATVRSARSCSRGRWRSTRDVSWIRGGWCIVSGRSTPTATRSRPRPAGSVLVGASPELLVSRHGSEVRANPLAGSAPRSGDPEEDRANAEALGLVGEGSSGARDRRRGGIRCAASALRGAPPRPRAGAAADGERLASLDAVPRPAAGPGSDRARARRGAPSDAGCGGDADGGRRSTSSPSSSRSIAAATPGPVGWVDADGDGEWAIALRCAELAGERATLFAGAGIVADSDPARELDETERKFRAFLDSLRWG